MPPKKSSHRQVVEAILKKSKELPEDVAVARDKLIQQGVSVTAKGLLPSQQKQFQRLERRLRKAKEEFEEFILDLKRQGLISEHTRVNTISKEQGLTWTELETAVKVPRLRVLDFLMDWNNHKMVFGHLVEHCQLARDYFDYSYLLDNDDPRCMSAIASARTVLLDLERKVNAFIVRKKWTDVVCRFDKTGELSSDKDLFPFMVIRLQCLGRLAFVHAELLELNDAFSLLQNIQRPIAALEKLTQQKIAKYKRHGRADKIYEANKDFNKIRFEQRFAAVLILDKYIQKKQRFRVFQVLEIFEDITIYATSKPDLDELESLDERVHKLVACGYYELAAKYINICCRDFPDYDSSRSEATYGEYFKLLEGALTYLQFRVPLKWQGDAFMTFMYVTHAMEEDSDYDLERYFDLLQGLEALFPENNLIQALVQMKIAMLRKDSLSPDSEISEFVRKRFNAEQDSPYSIELRKMVARLQKEIVEYQMRMLKDGEEATPSYKMTYQGIINRAADIISELERLESSKLDAQRLFFENTSDDDGSDKSGSPDDVSESMPDSEVSAAETVKLDSRLQRAQTCLSSIQDLESQLSSAEDTVCIYVSLAEQYLMLANMAAHVRRRNVADRRDQKNQIFILEPIPEVIDYLELADSYLEKADRIVSASENSPHKPAISILKYGQVVKASGDSANLQALIKNEKAIFDKFTAYRKERKDRKLADGSWGIPKRLGDYAPVTLANRSFEKNKLKQRLDGLTKKYVLIESAPEHIPIAVCLA